MTTARLTAFVNSVKTGPCAEGLETRRRGVSLLELVKNILKVGLGIRIMRIDDNLSTHVRWLKSVQRGSHVLG